MFRIHSFALASLAAGVVTGTASHAQQPDGAGNMAYVIRVPGVGVLASVDGRARVRSSREVGDRDMSRYPRYPYEDTSQGWRVTRTERGHTIRVQDSREYRGWFLSYDPRMPGKGVFLTEQATDGSYWDIDRIPTSTAGEPIRARVPGGGWFLDREREGVEYFNGKVIRTIDTLYELKLTHEEEAKFEIFGAAP